MGWWGQHGYRRWMTYPTVMNIGTNAPSKTRIVMLDLLLLVEAKNHKFSPLATSRIEAGTSANRGKPQVPRTIPVMEESLAIRSSSFHFGAILPRIVYTCL